MSKHTRRRHQNAGSMLSMFDSKEESFETSKQRINEIISNVQTTREELQSELILYEKKMTVLETEFNQYQDLAQRVMAALDVIDGATRELVTPETPTSPQGNGQPNQKSFFGSLFNANTPVTPQSPSPTSSSSSTVASSPVMSPQPIPLKP